MSRVSVVIPCYNHAEYIGRAVHSCLRQEHLREVIIVDDNSSDESWSELQRLARQIPVVRTFRTSANSGAGAARNLGARQAEGEFLCFLDADDDLLSGYFASTVTELDANPQFTSIKVGMQFVDPLYEPVILPGDSRYMALLASSSCNLMLRRAAFERLGGFPEDPRFRGPLGGEDAAFSRAVENNLAPIGYLPEAFYRVHDRPGSHLQKFLLNTRVVDNHVFEFLTLAPEQQADGALGRAIDEYLQKVGERFA